MPNYCNYDMRIKGSKKAINRVIECLKADYNYGKGKPSHKHFFRVFECNDEGEFHKEANGEFSKTVYGYLAWSCSSCMLSGTYSYYQDVKKSNKDTFMGTDLAEQSRDCTIEVFSEEEGMCFSEHYLFKNGICYIDDTCDIQSAGYDKEGNLTTEIDWDTYDGDIYVKNPHREGAGYSDDNDFAWVI